MTDININQDALTPEEVANLKPDDVVILSPEQLEQVKNAETEEEAGAIIEKAIADEQALSPEGKAKLDAEKVAMFQEATEPQGEPLTPSEGDASNASNPTETVDAPSPSEEVEPLAEGEE